MSKAANATSTSKEAAATFEDALHAFIFKSTIRTAVINREIHRVLGAEDKLSAYRKMCSIVLTHANDVRVATAHLEQVDIPEEKKETLKHTLRILSVEGMIYHMGHALIKIKGLINSSNINTCFVRRTKKFWVHLDDVETLLATVIPHLPVYIFGDDGSGKVSSSISSVYFDTPDFFLYRSRIKREQSAKALRIRKYGESSIIAYVELKTHEEGWTGEKSTKKRFLVHTKSVPLLAQGKDIWEDIKAINSPDARPLYIEVLSLIRDLHLIPVVKTFYARTAFQFPNDSSIRISMDTSLTMWRGIHGKRFPYAVLEVKLEEGVEREWIHSMMNSDLVIPVDKFSKYIHGCAVHYPNVPALPYWYNQMQGLKKKLVDVQVFSEHHAFNDINSEISGILQKMKENAQIMQPPTDLPLAVGEPDSSPSDCTSGGSDNSCCRSGVAETHEIRDTSRISPAAATGNHFCNGGGSCTPTTSGRKDVGAIRGKPDGTERSPIHSTTAASLFFSSIPLGAPREAAVPSGSSDKQVVVPVRIEPKVFFANERTFLSWLHFAIFIGGIGAALMGLGDKHAALSGVCFITVSIIFSVYSLYLYTWRAQRIREKHPGPYDDHNGPVVLVAVFLSAMVTSVFFKYPID